MNFSTLLSPEAVLPDMAARTKQEALSELAGAVLLRVPSLARDDVLRILEKREALGTTAVGDGVAIPHGKMEGLTENVLVVGRSKAGVDFGATDNKLCHLFFLIIVPEGEAGQHLRLLAQIARLAKDAMFRANFMQAPDGSGLWRFLATF